MEQISLNLAAHINLYSPVAPSTQEVPEFLEVLVYPEKGGF